MSNKVKAELEACETVSDMFVVLSKRYELSEPLSYSKKIMLLAGLKKAIMLLNPKER